MNNLNRSIESRLYVPIIEDTLNGYDNCIFFYGSDKGDKYIRAKEFIEYINKKIKAYEMTV